MAIARWMQHHLSHEQKRQRVILAQEMFDIFDRADRGRFPDIVTGVNFIWCIISDRTGIGCHPILGDTLL